MGPKRPSGSNISVPSITVGATEDEAVAGPPSLSFAAGLVLVWNGDRAECTTYSLEEPLTIGRSREATIQLDDSTASGKHTEVSCQGDVWVVRDLGSRNGTFVDGERIEGTVTFAEPRVLRVGRNLFVFEPRIGAWSGQRVTREGGVVNGPRIVAVLETAARAASTGKTLLITGETGAGKERVAHTFHKRGPNARGPFVAVNCAAIPKELAEALLFGAVRGAYSGAHAGQTGFLEQAEGGVLFLDELGELSLDVQAKLLRAIETGLVQPLGARSPKPFNALVCSATNVDLERAIEAGTFRRDLHARLSQRQVHLPALRERPEEIPAFVELAIEASKCGIPASAKLVELCILSTLPGNVRGLFNAVEQAAENARHANATAVGPEHVAASALGGRKVTSSLETASEERDERRDRLAAALAESGGDVAKAAKILGLGKTTVYDAIKKYGLKR